MRNSVMFAVNYGPIVAGTPYEVLENGYDYVAVRCNGKRQYVFSNLIGRPKRSVEEDYEDDEPESWN